MPYPFLSQLTSDAIRNYTKICVPTGDWVSYCDPKYAPKSVSPNAGRFNEVGTPGYYIASGVWVAQKEVPKYSLRDLYKVNSHEIHYLDLYQLSVDRGFHEQFLRAKEDDGWLLCQASTSLFCGACL